MTSIQKLALPCYCLNELLLVIETHSVRFYDKLQTFESISESNVDKMKTLINVGKDMSFHISPFSFGI